ncbi:transporter substrate-binding domain-containing protein [Chitinivorax sp. B]|uniref:transporter substrate-binding domain-containing protein n=1 Tax=Chitinivorax sp. B TaxID=2502235 RepID=UPI0010FA119A|nr:transporter substrate-binding domain-containing protein [Chitinivorax sp. B]
MFKTIFLAAALFTATIPAMADDLDDIQKKGELVVGVKDSLPPFGVLDPKTRTVSGYDVDFAAAIAKRLNVKLLAKPVDSADRITWLKDKKVDMVIATFTKNAEREAQVDFSYGYFVTGQKFLTKAGRMKDLADIETAAIGTVKGSTSEKQVRKALPNANIMLFEDYPEAVKALSDGRLEAVTTDEPILAGLLNKMANRKQYEIPNVPISLETYGVAVRKGEKRLLKMVNDALLDMEKTGEASKIFERWFGHNTPNPMPRIFVIRGG